MSKMLAHLGPPQSLHVAQEPTPTKTTKPPRWRSLRSRGSKLYAWSLAARLSAEGKGAGVGLGLHTSGRLQEADEDNFKRELSASSLELLRLKAVRSTQRTERLKRERELALEAVTRMLAYLGPEDAGPPGARLAIDALREIGADDAAGERRGHR